MNNEDNHMIQKHVLAIALAIIQTKPTDITIDAYIQYIKKKITEKNMDSDLDITICDEDFNMSDEDFNMSDDDDQNDVNNSHDSVNILKDFGLNNLDDPPKERADSLIDVMAAINNVEDDEIFSQNVFSQPIHFNESQILTNNNVLTNEADETTDNIDTLTQINNEHDNTLDMINSTDVSNMNDLSQDNETTNTQSLTKNKKSDFNLINLNGNTDSQQTVLYTLQGLGNSYVSQSQDNLFVAKNHLYNKSNIASDKIIKDSNQIHDKQVIDIHKDVIINNSTNKQTEHNLDNNIKTNKIDKNISTDKYGPKKHNLQTNYHEDNKRMKIDTNENRHIDDPSDGLLDGLVFQKTNSTNHRNKDTATNIKNIAHDNFDKTFNKTNSFKETDDLTPELIFTDDTNDLLPNIRQDNHNIDNTLELIPSQDEEFQLAFEEAQNIFSKENHSNKDTLFEECIETNEKYDYNNDNYQNIKESHNTCILKEKINNNSINYNDQINNIDDEMKVTLNPKEKNRIKECILNNLSNDERNEADSYKESTNNDSNTNILTQFGAKERVNTPNDIIKEVISKENQRKVSISNENTQNTLTQFRTEDRLTITSDKIKEVISDEDQRREFISNENSQNVLTQLRTEEPIKIFSAEIKEVISKENQRKELISNENSQNILTQFRTKESITIPSYEIKENQRKELISNEETQIPSEKDDSKRQSTVSLKILYELNRVKSYLNRMERILTEDSMDSGFRSFQPRSSYKSASQYSQLWINASAHSLLNFISEGQLSASTSEIAEEISKTLGKLVDKLHDEENYPNFLDALLERVSTLLEDVHTGNNGPHSLLERDATIYRLLLCNRSTHVIHYTLEKIIVILENIYTEITDEIVELKDIQKLENLCYIFHVLEVILKRFKNSNEQSQMSFQNSQEDKILKKSSLTDMWRKKWNLSKCEHFEGSTKKTCILTACSGVLNKIIVQAMDGYSLVAFAALQCFNLLQS